jgi:hypothetical protein
MAHSTRHLELKTVGRKNDTSGYVGYSLFFLKKRSMPATFIHQQYLKGFVTLPVVSHLNIISRIYLATF